MPEATAQVAQELRDRLHAATKIAVCGVGNEWRADDGVGPAVIKTLEESLGSDSDRVLLLDCGVTPENYLDILGEERPSHVLFVDAGDTGQPPGTVTVVEPEQVYGAALSTHRIPLSVLSAFLRQSTGADIFIIAVQVESCDFGQGLTPRVREAAGEVALLLDDILREREVP